MVISKDQDQKLHFFHSSIKLVNFRTLLFCVDILRSYDILMKHDLKCHSILYSFVHVLYFNKNIQTCLKKKHFFLIQNRKSYRENLITDPPWLSSDVICNRHVTLCQTIPCFNCFNPWPDDKILGLPKLKAFADDKFNVTQNIKVFFHRIENIVGKEENAGYQHFLLFPLCALPCQRQKSLF